MLSSREERMPSAHPPADALDRILLRAFAPLDKRALGIAVGFVFGALVAILTVFHVVVKPTDMPNIWLLGQYFYGYDVTVQGAFVGFWWAFVAGFAAGWFFAFVRNLTMAVWLLVIRTRASLAETRDFLDHI